MFGAAAMSLSSFCVVSNALRLNLFKLYDASKDKKKLSTAAGDSEQDTKESATEVRATEEGLEDHKTLQIDGMMCEHCEMRVQKALLSVAGVTGAQVSYKEGVAVVKLHAEVTDEQLKQAVEEQDYTVRSISAS